MAEAHFFNTVRPLFGRLSQGQVDGMNKMVSYAQDWEYSRLHAAYVIATASHETNFWMEPIREGASRYGPNYTDAQSKRAVASLKSRGLIRVDYAKPMGPWKQSYYGRGLIQITWFDNYLKFQNLLGVPLAQNPDLALEWNHALDILFIGMRDGMFRKGRSLRMIDNPGDWKAARDIVNGDAAKTWGGTERMDNKIARYAGVFYEALKGEL